MNMFRSVSLAFLLVLLTACGGGDTDIKATTHNTTMGQELMDLNNSYQQGIITEKEYNNAKDSIMERYK